MTAHALPNRVRILGADVDLVTPGEMLQLVDALAASGGPAVIANHNAHSLFLYRKSPELRAFFDEADLVQIDSTPMILWGRLLGLPVNRSHRSTYLDWRNDFWRLAAERRWRVYYLGGAPGIARAARAKLLPRWPEVTLECHDGYFDVVGAENQAVVDEINAFQPDILFVGMGMPRQEEWIAANIGALDQGVVFSVGAAFDYEAGAQRTPPRWTGRFGLEWLFRLFAEPRRLAVRYLIEPWFLLPSAFDDLGAALTGRGR